MTGHRHPGAVSEHPLRRVLIRHPSGATVTVSYQASEADALELAATYKRAIGWADAELVEVTGAR